MEQLKIVDAYTPPGTRVLVVGVEGWEIYGGDLVAYSASRTEIRGRDGNVSFHWSYLVHVMPEVTRG